MIEWYNENEYRPYPVDDSSYLKDDTGKLMPMSLLADLSISVPEDFGAVYITGLYCGPAMVSLALGDGTEGLLTAAASKTAAANYTPIYMNPVGDNISGHVVFGRGVVSHEGSYMFTQGQMKLDFHAIRNYHGGKVLSVNKFGGSVGDRLRGMVNISVAGAMSVRKIDDSTAVFSLNADAAPDFLSPCDKTADINRCGPPPIRSLNGVKPDAEGVIIMRVK